MSDKDENCTRERILAAAEKLFSEHGFDGTSMRSITALANVNLSVAYYYFKDKENLLLAVFDRYVLPMTDEMSAMLTAAREEAGTVPIALTRLLDAIVFPRLRLLSDSARRLFSVLFARCGATEKKIYAVFEERTASLYARFVDEFARTLPHLSRLELGFRIAALDAMLCGWNVLEPFRENRKPKDATPDRAIEMFRSFAVPFFTAPATPSAHD